MAELLGGLFKATGMTQRAIAGLAFVVPSRVSETLRGVGDSPSLDTVRRIAKALNATEEQQRRAQELVGLIGTSAPWVLGGDRPRDHVAMRAAGRRPGGGHSGDLFTGRSVAVDRVKGWLTAATGPGLPLVVTGQPGAGKSSVVARAARDLETSGVAGGVFFHARGTTSDEMLAAVQTLAGDPTITDTEGWLSHLRGRTAGGQQPLLVVVDALDEAISSSEITRISQLLTTVATEPALRVVVATRRGRGNQLLRHLGIRDGDAANLVDLDSDTYFDPADLRQVATRHLTQATADNYPGRSEDAWTRYRTDRALTDRLAAVIARRADRNFLVAAFAAHSLSTMREVLDPAAPGFDDTLIPSSVAEAFTKYFDTIPDERQRFRTGRLLTALAFAQGPGLDDDTWLLFADALGLAAPGEDIQLLRRSPVADYLLETEPDQHGLAVRTRLYHQALIDQLLNQDEPDNYAEPDDARRIFRRLTPTDPDGWSTASPYMRRYLADHAAAAGELLSLLLQPGYLAVADLTRVLPTLPAKPTGELREIATILRTCAHRTDGLNQLERVLLLAQAAAHLGLATWQDAFTERAVALGGPTLLWAQARSKTMHETLGGLVSTYAVAIGMLGDRNVIVSGGIDGTVGIWDLDGKPVGAPLMGHESWINAVAIGALGEQHVVVTGSRDGTARIWDLDGQPMVTLTGHDGPIAAVAIGTLGEQNVVVTGSHDGTARIWDADGHHLVTLAGHDGPITAVAIGTLGEQNAVVTGNHDGTARIWDADGHHLATLTGHDGEIRAVAIGTLGEQHIIVTGSHDGTARIWDASGKPVGAPLAGHDSWVDAVAIGTLGEQHVIVTGSHDYTARIWDADGHHLGTLAGHDGPIFAVAIRALGEQNVIVTGSTDDTVRIWDLDGQPVGAPLAGHDGWINAVAIGTVGEQHVIVTGSNETARIWDLDGQPVGAPLTGQVVAIGTLGEQNVIVTGSHDGTVRVWDLDGQPVGAPLTVHDGSDNWTTAVAIGTLGEQNVIVTGSSDGTTRIWDLDGQPLGTLTGHADEIRAVAIGTLGEQHIIVTGSRDGTARIWDASGKPVGAPLAGHDSWVDAVAIGTLGEQHVIVTGSNETARIWDPDGQPIGNTHKGDDPVIAIAIGTLGDRNAIVTGGLRNTLRIWNQHSLETSCIPTLSRVNAAVIDGSVVYAAVGPALVAWRFSDKLSSDIRIKQLVTAAAPPPRPAPAHIAPTRRR
ncbi:hypothetical protein [Micromonospora sp.]|uniref:nSTAND1 domain-containing NTPase n=1 Tax=Micromonospora sp. TaxID=1876 RepID=UPI003B3B9A24